jgi:hypothetical protein
MIFPLALILRLEILFPDFVAPWELALDLEFNQSLVRWAFHRKDLVFRGWKPELPATDPVDLILRKERPPGMVPRIAHLYIVAVPHSLFHHLIGVEALEPLPVPPLAAPDRLEEVEVHLALGDRVAEGRLVPRERSEALSLPRQVQRVLQEPPLDLVDVAAHFTNFRRFSDIQLCT